jgi:hypothetical protein
VATSTSALASSDTGRGTDTPGTPRRARARLEVELVERQLARVAQHRAGVERGERGAQRGGEDVEQGEVVAHGALHARPADADRDLLALEGAAVDLRGGPHGDRLGVKTVEHPAGRASPRAVEDALDLARGQDGAGRRARRLDLLGHTLARAGTQRLGLEDLARAHDADARRRGAARKRHARLGQRRQRRREVGSGRHPGVQRRGLTMRRSSTKQIAATIAARIGTLQVKLVTSASTAVTTAIAAEAPPATTRLCPRWTRWARLPGRRVMSAMALGYPLAG